MRQQRHTDFHEFNIALNAPEKPNSTILALCDNTQLHFYVGQDKQLVTVDMKKSGDCCFFAGDVLHAGAEWQGQEPNFRLSAEAKAAPELKSKIESLKSDFSFSSDCSVMNKKSPMESLEKEVKK